MNVQKNNGMYKSSRIAGPKHNYLGLALVSSPSGNVKIVQRSVKGDESFQIDESKLVFAVSEGLSEANRTSGRPLYIDCIEYVPSDTPDYNAYTDLAKTIILFALRDYPMSSATHIADVQRFRLINQSASELEVWLEPLGDRVVIPAGATYEVHLELHSAGEISDCLEVAVAEKKATLYGSFHSISLVSKDGGLTRIWPAP